MKNRQIVVLSIISILCLLLIIYTTSYVLKEINRDSDKIAASYEIISKENIEVIGLFSNSIVGNGLNFMQNHKLKLV